jgi:hypothetical protein
MSEQPTVTTTPEAPAGPAGVTDDQASALLADAVAAANKANAETPNATPWDDPAVAKAEIERLRKENGATRTNAKAQAAADARNEFAQTIGKALGLIQNDEPADPAALTAQLTAAGADARQAKIELAVFRAAQATDADPSALLDSRAFLVKLADVDPSDAAAITAAVTEAVAANPRLGKPAVPGMRPNPAQGHSASAPLGLAEQIAASEKAGDTKATIRLKAAMALDHN